MKAPSLSPHADFAARIIAWQQQHGRHALPWQGTRDAYRIWLSEIMLQQTQVAAVIPYYARFLERFPTLESLASAPQEAVLEHWAGLGYYARARNLHRCAQQVMERHGGIFPDDPAVLAELSGIGRSTAAAIAAFSSGRRAAILDGNVKRVFARHFGIEGFPGSPAVEKEMWALAETLLPKNGIETYIQGQMDLGATLCTRSRPHCAACPLAATCVANKTGRQGELPVAKPRKTIPEKTTCFVLVSDGISVLLQRRPPSGIWGGLLVPPEGEAESVLANLGLSGVATEALPVLVHTFTHFRLHIQPLLCRVQHLPATDAASWVIQPLAGIELAALPAPVRKLLETLLRPAASAGR